MSLEIRLATMHDYDALCALWTEGDEHHIAPLAPFFRRSAGPPRSREFVAGILADENAALFIAERDGAAVGFLHLYLRQTPDMPMIVPRTFVMVDSIVVARKARRSGVGTALMAWAEHWAREKGANQLELSVWEFNERARTLYERLGYRTITRRMWKSLEEGR